MKEKIGPLHVGDALIIVDVQLDFLPGGALPVNHGDLVIEYLEALQFTSGDLQFLEGLKTFPTAFLDYLASVRFTGSVHAMLEGTPFFANEPIVRVTAPILEAQLVESRILNLVHFQSMIASAVILAASQVGHFRGSRRGARQHTGRIGS